MSTGEDAVYDEVERAAAGVPVTTAFRLGLSPIEGEAYLAETLRRDGLTVRAELTPRR